MERYRITTGDGYNGCEPITVYWVQVRERKWYGDSWRNIKGFESKQRAIDLLNTLNSGL